MTDDTTRQLQYLAGRVRVHDQVLAQQGRQSLLNRITSGPTPQRVGMAQLQPQQIGAGSATDTLGNTQPFIGQTNLLLDPTFESGGGRVNVGTSPTTFGDWTAEYVLNSGSVSPGDLTVTLGSRGDPNNNPFNSGPLSVGINWATTFDADIYIWPTTDLTPTLIPTLDYLIAALRVGIAEGLVTTAIESLTTYTAQLEWYDVGGSAVIGTQSPLIDLKTLPNMQLVAFVPTDISTIHTKTLRWRLHLHAVPSGSLGAGQFPVFGEPQIHFAYTPDPVPFSPQLAGWEPVDANAVHSGDAAGGDLSGTYPNPTAPKEWTTVTKGSDTTINANTTLANDPDLAFSTVSGKLYRFEIVLAYQSSTTADLKFTLGETTSSIDGGAEYLGLTTSGLIAAAPSALNTATNGTPGTLGGFGVGTTVPAMISGYHLGGGGTFHILWAQNASDATNTVVKAGSVLRYRQLN